MIDTTIEISCQADAKTPLTGLDRPGSYRVMVAAFDPDGATSIIDICKSSSVQGGVVTWTSSPGRFNERINLSWGAEDSCPYFTVIRNAPIRSETVDDATEETEEEVMPQTAQFRVKVIGVPIGPDPENKAPVAEDKAPEGPAPVKKGWLWWG